MSTEIRDRLATIVEENYEDEWGYPPNGIFTDIADAILEEFNVTLKGFTLDGVEDDIKAMNKSLVAWEKGGVVHVEHRDSDPDALKKAQLQIEGIVNALTNIGIFG